MREARVEMLIAAGLSESEASLVEDLSSHALMEAVKTIRTVLSRLPPHLRPVAAVYTYRAAAANFEAAAKMIVGDRS